MSRRIIKRFGVGFTAALLLAISTKAAFAQQKAVAQPLETVKPGKKASIFDKSANADIQIAQATERAQRDNKRVLVMFGGDWCAWCHRLHELLANGAALHGMLRNDYELVLIDLEALHAQPLLNRCKEALGKDDLKKGVAFPFLAILDSAGKVVTAQRTDPFEEGNQHDPTKVLAFLSKWAVVQQDARVVLNESLARASSEDKKLFLTFATPGCNWCHRLDEWLRSPDVAPILERDFIVAKVDVDRMKNGKELMIQYRTGSTSGIPWYTVLDSKGTSLATADGPDGNIGYPLTPKEIDQFLAMVKGQVKQIDDHHLVELRKSLERAAIAINAQQVK